MSERKFQDDDIDIWGNPVPICPYCGHGQDVTELNSEFEEFIDDEIIETECDSCEKNLYIQLNMPIKYNTFVDVNNA